MSRGSTLKTPQQMFHIYQIRFRDLIKDPKYQNEKINVFHWMIKTATIFDNEQYYANAIIAFNTSVKEGIATKETYRLMEILREKNRTLYDRTCDIFPSAEMYIIQKMKEVDRFDKLLQIFEDAEEQKLHKNPQVLAAFNDAMKRLPPPLPQLNPKTQFVDSQTPNNAGNVEVRQTMLTNGLQHQEPLVGRVPDRLAPRPLGLSSHTIQNLRSQDYTPKDTRFFERLRKFHPTTRQNAMLRRYAGFFKWTTPLNEVVTNSSNVVFRT